MTKTFVVALNKLNEIFVGIKHVLLYFLTNFVFISQETKNTCSCNCSPSKKIFSQCANMFAASFASSVAYVCWKSYQKQPLLFYLVVPFHRLPCITECDCTKLTLVQFIDCTLSMLNSLAFPPLAFHLADCNDFCARLESTKTPCIWPQTWLRNHKSDIYYHRSFGQYRLPKNIFATRRKWMLEFNCCLMWEVQQAGKIHSIRTSNWAL